MLRLRPGEAVSTADGRGGWRLCRLGAGGVLAGDGPALQIERAEPEVTVAFAVPKGDRAEWAVQKLTEVGVDRVVPLVAERSVIRWDAERAGRHLAKWRSVARQAAMQSRRARIPRIDPPAAPADLAGPAAAMADPDGAPVSLVQPTVLIGPEGGWSPAEFGLGLPLVGLTPTVLRTETAAVVAGVLLVAARAGAAPT